MGRQGYALVLALCVCLQAGWVLTEKIECEKHGEEVECEGVSYKKEEMDVPGTPQFFTDLALCIFFVLFAGLMSGLTIGLLSLDTTTLQVLKASGEPHERVYASSILPLVHRRHLLLVTLLLCNACAMEALPIFLDRMMPSYAAILVSVTAVLFFGEIIPQAICSRYGLAIGHYMAWPVRILIGLIFFISYPISLLLDWILGVEHSGTLFARGELKELVYLHHSENREDESEKLTTDEVTIMRAAIDMGSKTVADAMTKLASVYAVEKDQILDEKLIQEIVDTGHSRIPVYDGSKDNIVGALLVKKLVLCNPKKKLPVRDLMGYYLHVVASNTRLYDMLNEFQKGHGHMAVVKNAESGMTLGIITLEDIIEELIAEEIVDETDRFVDVEKAIHVVRQPRQLAGYATHRRVSTIVRMHSKTLGSASTNIPPHTQNTSQGGSFGEGAPLLGSTSIVNVGSYRSLQSGTSPRRTSGSLETMNQSPNVR
eukprot:comp19244_c0_seq1/m.22023 comp19244_c0_seq1/g.22023  ORF comp19244_c0_seq1/g.22023 comp19244_c0_seq1/m.22023 type:complete len:485 (-) comp19244_c0_seq1:213-1667(-)